MAGPYSTVSLLRDDLQVSAAFRQRFSDQFSDHGAREVVRSLFEAQVDLERATQIFVIIRAGLSGSNDVRMETMQLVWDLYRCGMFAVSDVYNSSSSAIAQDVDNIFGRIHCFCRSKLGTEPIPGRTDQPQTNKAQATASASARDGVAGDHWSGPICPLTGLPHAETAHILPYQAAGAVRGRRWMWLWLAVILPKPLFDAAWQAGGGRNQYASSNVLMLCTELHSYYDALRVCFWPIVEEGKVPFTLRLEIPPFPASEFPKQSFFALRRAQDGKFIEHGMEFPWLPRSQISQREAPSPLLLSINRYFAHLRAILPVVDMRGPPPPAPSPLFEQDPDNNAWEVVAAQKRGTSSTDRSKKRLYSQALMFGVDGAFDMMTDDESGIDTSEDSDDNLDSETGANPDEVLHAYVSGWVEKIEHE